QGILIDGTSTIANCAANSLVKNCYVEEDTANYIGFVPADDVNVPQATTQLNGNGNIYSEQYEGVLANPNFPITNIDDMLPASGSPLQGADNSVYGGDAFFTNVSYIGAFNPGGDTWAHGWTNFDPQNTLYSGIHSLPSSIFSIDLFPNPAKESLQL